MYGSGAGIGTQEVITVLQVGQTQEAQKPVPAVFFAVVVGSIMRSTAVSLPAAATTLTTRM